MCKINAGTWLFHECVYPFSMRQLPGLMPAFSGANWQAGISATAQTRREGEALIKHEININSSKTDSLGFAYSIIKTIANSVYICDINNTVKQSSILFTEISNTDIKATNQMMCLYYISVKWRISTLAPPLPATRMKSENFPH